MAAGGLLTYSPELSNGGPDAAAFVHLDAVLPGSATFESLLAPPGWSFSTPPVGIQGVVACTVSALAVGETATAILVARIPYCAGDGTLLVGTASASSAAVEEAPGDESDVASTTVIDDGACDDGDPCSTNDACQAGFCTGEPALGPQEVRGLRIGPWKTTLAWEPADDADGGYEVVRGVVTELPVGFGSPEECLGTGLAENSIDDATDPASGAAFWYLVRALGDCAAGSYGSTSGGTERVTAVCP